MLFMYEQPPHAEALPTKCDQVSVRQTGLEVKGALQY